ncbi:MAG: portal protein [Verrucomicrobiota bacterium]
MSTPAEIRKQLRTRMAQMDTDRQRWRSHWLDLQSYLLPEHGFGLSGSNSQEQTDGGKKHGKIIDNTASKSLNVLAAGLQSGLTSPTRPWFRLALGDKDLMAFFPVKLWLETVEERIRYVLNRSNAYRSLHHGYLELGAFGTWAQLVTEDFQTGIHCRPFTIGEFWLGVDHKLNVNSFYRSFWQSPEQMIAEFGRENVSAPVALAYDNNQTALFEVIQAIEPNDDRISVDDAGTKPWRSVYFEAASSEEKLLQTSGYDDFPVQAPRWAVVAGKVYGYSVGMENLGDTKMLQKLSEKQLVNMDKALTPPLKAPSSLKNEVINTVPGGVTYTDDMTGRDNFTTLYNVPDMLQSSQMVKSEVQQRIKTGFFTDLFLMLQNLDKRNMTATEVSERHEEKLLMLGPVLERLDSELLDPLIDRIFNILLRTGMLPPAPQEIQGQVLHVEYISVLAQAQKLVGVTNLQQFSGFVGSLGAVQPQTFDKVDFDAMVDDYADRVGVSPRVIRTPEMVAQLRADRAKQQQMQQAMAAGQQLADGAKTLSETDTKGNNALAAIMGRMPGLSPAAA